MFDGLRGEDPEDVVYAFGGSVFQWNARKAELNFAKHGVRFEDAVVIFEDNDGVLKRDEEHSFDEQRFMLVGSAAGNRIVAVVHVERGFLIRLISARKATIKERREYDLGRRVEF